MSSTGQDLAVQLEKLAGCDKIFKEKRSGVDTGRPELKRCLEYLREGDTLGILALIAEFEKDIRRERQMDSIAKAKERGVHFGRKSRLLRSRWPKSSRYGSWGKQCRRLSARQTSVRQAYIDSGYCTIP